LAFYDHSRAGYFIKYPARFFIVEQLLPAQKRHPDKNAAKDQKCF